MQDPVSRLTAALSGRYEIERELGQGGMATVYLASDVKHQRGVALKVLKPELAAVIGAERFLAEIRTTANLQHPHILPLHDSGKADGLLFYVMPHVEGESLRERLDREHQLPVDEAVRIATNVAEALDYAHRHGVIHRDIKPANILLQDGKPVVSDFGIALAVTAGGAGRLTETGLSLGTPHYMSPEQATGDQTVGAGSDIYALGCVLYEMLVGEPPYTGSTPQAILGKIIQAKPVSATEVRRTVPANVDAAIRKSLEKVPADRFRSAADFARALIDPGFRHALGLPLETVQSGVGASPWNRQAVGFASLSVVLAALAVWSLLGREPSTARAEVRRFAIDLPEEGFRPGLRQPMALTPDGSALLLNVGPIGSNQLFVRPLGGLEMVAVRGTENVGSFFVSPDGAWVGLNDPEAQALVKIPIGGGPSSAIAETPGSAGGFRGASWGDAGLIVYAIGAHQGLMRVRDVGGVPDTLTIPEGSGEVHRDPHVFPGGETVAFVVARTNQEPQLAALSVGSGEYELLTQGEDPRYVRGGYLVFRRGSALWAAAFEAGRRRLTSEPVPVVEGLGNRHFTLSGDGTLVYATGQSAERQELAVVGFTGGEQRLPLTPRPIGSVGWSPDGESVVFESEGQIYTHDVVLATSPRQITFEGTNSLPVFSPDGTRVAFSSRGIGTDGTDLFVKDLRDDSPPRSILRLDGNQLVTQWPADTLIVFERGEGAVRSLWMVDISDLERPEARPYLTSVADLQRVTLSPDGGLAAYRSTESGRYGLYLRSFPTPGERTVVSPEAITGLPIAILGWSRDGTTLYHGLGPRLPLRATRIQRGRVPVVLSTDTLSAVLGPPIEPRSQALHPDGDRFIFAVAEETEGGQGGEAGRERLVVVLNFATELARLVGGN
jgi:serine/threonine-protein kinase